MKKILVIFLFFVFNTSVFSQQIQLNPYFVSKAKYVNYFTKIPSPSIYRDHNSLSKIQTLNISANYIGTWPSEAQNAFNYALNIWSYLIKSTIPIKIKAEWVPLGEGILAETNSTSYKKNFTNAPVTDVNYPVSLAEALSGTELNGSEEEINIRVSSDFSWYYGLDGNTPSEKHDLVSVILHEVTHGLGFSHSMQIENNLGSWGQNYPNDNEKGFAQYYEKFGVVGPNSTTIYRLTNTNQYPNPSGELADALQSNNLYFDGTITKQMYLNNLPKLYAPNPFEGGSTLAHFDEDTFPAGNQNSLMSAQLGMAESIHSPGELGIAVLQDLGWNVNRLITILSPKAGLAYMPGQTKEIKWTDNIGGAISIDLLKKDAFGNYQYYSTIASHPSPRGVSNSINWTIPNAEGTFRIRMIDNTFSGEGFGLSYPFIISNQAQVATPVILPAGGNFLTAQTITISCATTGATIYYTTNNTDPSSSNGTQYSNSFSINSDMVIKAIAVKSGFPDSEIKSETYTFGTMPPPASITPTSGPYPVPITIEANWSANIEGYVAWTNNGTEPTDPKTANWNIPSERPWRLTVPDPGIIKINARTKQNGVWGPLVQRTYDLKPSLRVAQIDDEITQGPNSFGTWNKWEDNTHWAPHPDETIIRPTSTPDWFLQALQEFKGPDVFIKYNVWSNNLGDNYFVNHAKISVGPNTSSVLAHFKQAYDVIVTNKLENSFSVNQGSFILKNPWIVDDNSDSKGPRNRGDGTVVPLYPYTINFSTTPNITTGSIHKGVFLDQDPTFDPAIPNYSLKVDAVQNVSLTNTGNPSGRNHKFYFQNWGGSNVNYQNANALETPVVFTSDGATAQANLKGTQLTNTVYSDSKSGQRGFLRDHVNGYLHNVYESMGSVWYERSTDNGTTWILMNEGHPVNPGGNGKSPSICENLSVAGLFIVYQCDNPPYDGIGISKFGLTINDITPLATGVIGQITDYNHTNDYQPVIAATGYDGGVVVCNPPIIGFRAFNFSVNGSNITTSEFSIPSSANSKNPSIVGYLGRTHLVFDEAGLSIKYYSWLPGNPTYSSTVSVSSGTTYNLRPVISLLYGGKVVISWIGATTGYYPTRLNTRVGTPIGTSMNWGSINAFYGLVSSVSNASNINSTQQLTLITWKDMYGTKWQKRESTTLATTYSTPSALSHNGTWTHATIGLGESLSNTSAKVQIFNSSSLPYYFIPSTTDFAGNNNSTDGGMTLNGSGNVFLGKITEEDTIITFGRSGVASINDVEFVFEIGDILVGDSVIRFIEIPDTLVYNSTNELNQHTRTNNFTLTPNTNFYFSNIYYVVQKSDPDTALLSTDAVNFKVELVNANNNQVIGTFDNITYNKNSIEKYASIDYSVDCSGITSGEYYLRLVTNVNGYASYTLTNIFNENTTLAKKNYYEVKFTGSEIPTTYDLAQNFPNPFNPSTTIRFQIPQDGIVSLKIYDILGAEVATLVNEQKVAGKYEVNFNASTLASGVYIYKLQAGDFISSKKMILLK